MNSLDLPHSTSASHLKTTDPFVILFLIENTEETAKTWHHLREGAMPVFLSSFNKANPGVPICILKATTSGRTYPMLLTSNVENIFQDIVFDAPRDCVLSSRLVKQYLLTLDLYTSAANIPHASRHLVLISASKAKDDILHVGSAAESLATDLCEKEISLHVFIDYFNEQNFILDVLAHWHVANPGKEGSVQYPLGFSDAWVFRSTVPQKSTTMIPSVYWTPTLFSSDVPVLDAKQFMPPYTAEMLQKCEEEYDWDELRVLASEGRQM